MQVQAYLFFDGRCEEAVEFYKKALGAKVEMLMRFKESPDPPPPGMLPPGSENKIMHSCLRIGDTAVMASDGGCTGKAELPGVLALARGRERCRGRPALGRARRRGHGADADREDLFVPALRHGDRPLRRVVDGQRRAMNLAQEEQC